MYNTHKILWFSKKEAKSFTYCVDLSTIFHVTKISFFNRRPNEIFFILKAFKIN